MALFNIILDYKNMRLIILILILIPYAGLTAQVGETGNAGRSNTEDFSNFLMLSVDYSTNSDVLGKLSETIDQPAFSSTLSYLGESGIDASLTGYFIGNSDDSLEHYAAELDLMIGYRLDVSGSLAIYPAYSHYFYSRNANDLQKIFTDEFSVDADYTYKFLNFGVTPGIYLGKQHTFFINLRNYYSINFGNVIFNNSMLSIQPGIDLNFGDFEYLNRYYLDKMKENDLFYYYLLLSREVRRYVHVEKAENPELTVYQILNRYLNEKIQDRFKLTSAFFYLPVSYLVGNVSFNAGLYAFLPIKQPDYLANELQFFFNIGISYGLAF